MWWRLVGSRVRIVNQYGPTEATVAATSCDLIGEGGVCVGQSGETPIGRPVWNTTVYLLDERRKPVAVGDKGEIYIGGVGLARGYLHRPELTAERFIDHPFDASPGARLYRTGDIGRFLSDGSLQIAGRTDQQVKVRGFRVELGEVEAALACHTAIAEVVVVARTAESGSTRLTAYFSENARRSTSPRELREYLKRTLPDFMIPGGFVRLESLPRSPNGKIDRAALREMEDMPADEPPTFTAPRTPIERQLAIIWAQVLGVEQVGVDDNYFDLGGHSLLSLQLIARIEKRLGRALSVAVLFQSPTIGQLAAVLSDERRTDGWSSLIPVQPYGTQQPFFWIHGDSSNTHLPEYLGSERPLYGLEHQAHDGRPARYTAVETMANHYLDEVRSVRPKGPYLLGGYSFGAVVAFEMAHQLRQNGDEVALLFLLDPPGTPNDSWRSALIRARQRVGGFSRRRKLAYLLSRVSRALRDYLGVKRARIERLRKKWLWHAYLLRGRVLPPSLRSAYILDVYRHALGSYAPRGYPGSVTIFKGDEVAYGPPWDWPGLIAGRVDLHEAPGSHRDLMQEPHVGVWARRLKEALDRCGV
jgi:thioesterase domain-containing protein/acyl carrier protein